MIFLNKYYKLQKSFNELVFNIKRKILKKYKDNNFKIIKRNLYKSFIIVSKITFENNKNINIVNNFDELLDKLMNSLRTDLFYFYESDPAATNLKEIVLTYPGFHAIIIYRLAHLLNNLDVKYLPRMLSEYAHSLTGIDIHPGAIIDDYFFIDHGTGLVIGETAIIGHHVKIYQGVTIGALSLGRGQKLKGTKRHPTIGNYVTIYAGASILGGETVIGDNVTVGANAYILESMESNLIVKNKEMKMEILNKNILNK